MSSIRDFTTTDLIVIHWSEKMEDAGRLMGERGIGHLPVVTEEKGIIGVISERDFQRALMLDQLDTQVRNFMCWPVESIEEGTSIQAAAKQMLASKVSSLIVVRGERAVGILTTDDLLRAMVEESHGLRDMKEEVTAAVYNSPIGGIMQTLANAGI